MRPVGIGDVIAAARALLTVPNEGLVNFAKSLLHRARTAYEFQLCYRRPHPLWGTGSLMSAVMRSPQPVEPQLDDAAYRQALVIILTVLGENDVGVVREGHNTIYP